MLLKLTAMTICLTLNPEITPPNCFKLTVYNQEIRETEQLCQQDGMRITDKLITKLKEDHPNTTIVYADAFCEFQHQEEPI